MGVQSRCLEKMRRSEGWRGAPPRGGGTALVDAARRPLNWQILGIASQHVRAISCLMTALPQTFTDWFAAKGWRPHQHQLDLLAGSVPGSTQLLIAPTGGGKTLAGFLPSLVELTAKQSSSGLTRGSRTAGKDPRVEPEGDAGRLVRRRLVMTSAPRRPRRTIRPRPDRPT